MNDLVGTIDCLLLDFDAEQPLGELRDSGVLTEDEFAAQKAKVLAAG